MHLWDGFDKGCAKDNDCFINVKSSFQNSYGLPGIMAVYANIMFQSGVSDLFHDGVFTDPS